MDTNQQEPEQEKAEDALVQFVKELGIDSLPQDKQNEIVIKMTEVLLKRIFLETMEQLGEDGRHAYEDLTEAEDVTPQQAEAFFKERISGYDDMVHKVIEEFKIEMTAKQI